MYERGQEKERYREEYSQGYRNNGGQEYSRNDGYERRSESYREYREDPPIEQAFQQLNVHDV